MNDEVFDGDFTITTAEMFWADLRVHDTAALTRLGSEEYAEGSGVRVPSLETWSIDGQPLLWHSLDRTKALINKQFFSDLDVIDLTCLEHPARIGLVTPDLFRRRACPWIVHCLLRTGILRTFVHSHADLRLKYREIGSVYREVYSATHVFFTNEEIRRDYGFSVTITLDDREITALPG